MKFTSHSSLLYFFSIKRNKNLKFKFTFLINEKYWLCIRHSFSYLHQNSLSQHLCISKKLVQICNMKIEWNASGWIHGNSFKMQKLNILSTGVNWEPLAYDHIHGWSKDFSKQINYQEHLKTALMFQILLQ